MQNLNFTVEHENILDEAQRIFERRGRVRGQMWLETPLHREFDMMQEKLTRARAAYNREHFGDGEEETVLEFEDSLLDLINYAAFAIKKRRRGIVL